MSLHSTLHLIFGEYTFSVSCSDFLRLSHLITQKKLSVWGIKQEGENVCFCASLVAGEAVASLAEVNNIELTLISKRGLPFIFSRYRRRYGLIIGGAVFMLLLFVSQLFVWKIEISGNESITRRELELALDSIGVSVGSYIPSIDRLEKANELLLNCRGLSSASISINGTHISVSVLERRQIPERASESGFYNVVAEYDGVILDIDAEMGTPEVREGDTVYKGELLINSFMERTNGSFRATHARGRVYAAVKEKIDIEIPLKQRTKVYTGRSETKICYRILGQELFGGERMESGYEYFDAIATERDIKLFGWIELPIREYRIVYREYTVLYSDIGEEEAEERVRLALDDALSELDCEILSVDTVITTEKKRGVCLLKADATVKRDIAREIPYEILKFPKDSKQQANR